MTIASRFCVAEPPANQPSGMIARPPPCAAAEKQDARDIAIPAARCSRPREPAWSVPAGARTAALSGSSGRRETSVCRHWWGVSPTEEYRRRVDDACAFLRFSVTYEAPDETAEDALMAETERRLKQIRPEF